jgi:hypothetical protein
MGRSSKGNASISFSLAPGSRLGSQELAGMMRARGNGFNRDIQWLQIPTTLAGAPLRQFQSAGASLGPYQNASALKATSADHPHGCHWHRLDQILPYRTPDKMATQPRN